MKKRETRYLNRELSWVEFNARVLDEGLQDTTPALERLKFLSIVSSNFDEFFMVRVAALKRQQRQGDKAACPSGLRPSQILRRLSERIHEIVETQYQRLRDRLLPELGESGLEFVAADNYSEDDRRYTTDYFDTDVFPTLTPLAVDPEADLPSTGNLRLHAAFRLASTGARSSADKVVIVQIPPGLGRFCRLPSEEGRFRITPMEDVIVRHAARLFPGYEVRDHLMFRVTRDADLSVDEERDEDFLEAMQEVLLERERSAPVRLAVSDGPPRLIAMLSRKLGVSRGDIYRIDGPLDLKAFAELLALPGLEDLRDKHWPPQPPPGIEPDESLWDVLKDRDVLLHHPYESFDPVVRLLTDAARDPDVMAIKITLYRTSGQSPIIRALAQAARNGKQVAALVELKARFDEDRNIGWAQQLERVGVIVIYGLAQLKVHSKAVLIVRRERAGVVRYVHLGTGNYNDRTARLYTDMGLLTTREDLTHDVALFFNTITGYSAAPQFRKLAMAPTQLRRRLLSLIEREIETTSRHNPGRIVAKMNSLVDPEMIEALYRASQAGIEVLLNVRGISCLRPGVRGQSENIRVVSIVDRFLEHSRVFYFRNGGNDEVYLSSADWMPRNLDRRVELMFPIEDRELKTRVIQALDWFFADNLKAHEMQPDGSYVRLAPAPGEKPFRCQQAFYQDARARVRTVLDQSQRGFVVRRKMP
jgi:polyphosphate kinase